MSSIVIAGDTSGSVTLQAPAVAGTTTLTLPATSGTIQTSGAGYTTNGVAYATSATGLATGSALTFDGTNFATTGKSFSASVGVGTNLYAGIGMSSGGDNAFWRAYATHIWQNVTDPSTATTGTELMRLNSTGLGIGTSSPSYKLQVNGTSNTVGLGITGTHAASDNGIYYNLGSAITGTYSTINAIVSATGSVNTTFGNSNTTNTGANSRLDMYVGGSGSGDPKITYTVSGVLNWCVGVDNSDSDKFKISGSDSPGTSDYLIIDTSGKLLVATTTVIDSARMTIKGSATVINAQTETDGSYVLRVTNAAGSGVGGVVANSSSTSYLTSSDYRLKNTIAPITGALAKVALFKPVTYKWNVDGSDGEGFIAHELAEVCPDAVTGAKDAVDEEGNPKYQGIDTSFLVATLTAAIKEQQALITQLTERITALEAN